MKQTILTVPSPAAGADNHEAENWNKQILDVIIPMLGMTDQLPDDGNSLTTLDQQLEYLDRFGNLIGDVDMSKVEKLRSMLKRLAEMCGTAIEISQAPARAEAIRESVSEAVEESLVARDEDAIEEIVLQALGNLKTKWKEARYVANLFIESSLRRESVAKIIKCISRYCSLNDQRDSDSATALWISNELSLLAEEMLIATGEGNSGYYVVLMADLSPRYEKLTTDEHRIKWLTIKANAVRLSFDDPGISLHKVTMVGGLARSIQLHLDDLMERRSVPTEQIEAVREIINSVSSKIVPPPEQ